VLGRVVVVCQQRRCQITSLSYRAADRHRAGELVLSVRAPAEAADRLPRWLLRLVDVEAVHEAGAEEPWHDPPAHPARSRSAAGGPACADVARTRSCAVA
jgi:hypothetical protein